MAERTARALLLDPDPDTGEAKLLLTSIKDTDWRHQDYALRRGYTSMITLAVDELLAAVGEMNGRLDVLEAEIRALKAGAPVTTYSQRVPLVVDAEDRSAKGRTL